MSCRLFSGGLRPLNQSPMSHLQNHRATARCERTRVGGGHQQESNGIFGRRRAAVVDNRSSKLHPPVPFAKLRIVRRREFPGNEGGPTGLPLEIEKGRLD